MLAASPAGVWCQQGRRSAPDAPDDEHKMQDTQNDDLTVATTEPAEPDTDELHTEQDDEPEQPGQQAEQQQPEPEQPKPARNPRPSRRGDKQPPAPAPAPAEPEQPAPASEPVGAEVAPKRGRGRPKKAEQPAKKAAAPAGADVNPQRSAQVDAIKGLLQLRASKIASLACMVVGWEALNQEEELLVDAEFEGWSPPPEARKAVVLAVVALPRALADNRIRQLVGLPSVGGGDAAAQRAAELQAQQQQAMRAAQVPVPVVVDAAPVEAPPAPAPAAPAPTPAPTGEQLATSPLFAGQTVKVPKGFV